MSRTDLDPATLARSLRRMAGDGSVEWVMEPMQASVLLDIADMLDENAKLRELVRDLLQPILADGFDCYGCVHEDCDGMQYTDRCRLLDQARELGVEVEE